MARHEPKHHPQSHIEPKCTRCGQTTHWGDTSTCPAGTGTAVQEMLRQESMIDWKAEFLRERAEHNNARQGLMLIPELQHEIAYATKLMRLWLGVDTGQLLELCGEMSKAVGEWKAREEKIWDIARAQAPACAHPEPAVFAARMQDLRDLGAATIALELSNAGTANELLCKVMVESRKITTYIPQAKGKLLSKFQAIDAILTDLFDELCEPESNP